MSATLFKIFKRSYHRPCLNTSPQSKIKTKPYVPFDKYGGLFTPFRILTVGVSPWKLLECNEDQRKTGANITYLNGDERGLLNKEFVKLRALRVKCEQLDFVYYPEMIHPLTHWAIQTRCLGKSRWNDFLYPASGLRSWFSKNPFKTTFLKDELGEAPHLIIAEKSTPSLQTCDVPVLKCNWDPKSEEIEHINETIKFLIIEGILNQQRKDDNNDGFQTGLVVGTINGMNIGRSIRH